MANQKNLEPVKPEISRTGILIILDGFGINLESDTRYNAIAQAKTPTLDRLLKTYPHSQLDASEHHVGLPAGFMGNSEVGHLNIGAGRIIYQDFSQISHAIEIGSFFTNPAFLHLFETMQKQSADSTLHLIGLASDGGVHSHLSHLLALLQLAQRRSVKNVAIHFISDGRDTAPVSGLGFLKKVEGFCQTTKVGKVQTLMGRFYAMDRDNRWDRIQSAYEAIVLGKSQESFSNPDEYLQKNYHAKVTDEFIPPACLTGYTGIKAGDGVIFINFRADRAREMTRALTQVEFDGFSRGEIPKLAGFVGMTPYDSSFHLPAAYEKAKISDTLGEVVSRLGRKQLRIAETEKYAHVTYFFNGGTEKENPGEKRVLIPSPRDVKTYDLKPEMSAQLVTDRLLTEVKSENYAFVVVNYANCDMVGHTGNLKAAVEAVEFVDFCVGRIVHWIEANSAFGILTADHGNCEVMCTPSGEPFTSHTLLPVPFIVIDPRRHNEKVSNGSLCDIAPTLLALWGMEPPKAMTGKNLLVNASQL